MKQVIIEAVKKHAEGNIAKSKAKVQVFLNNPVGVATHMDSVETVVKELKVIADNKEIIESIASPAPTLSTTFEAKAGQ